MLFRRVVASYIGGGWGKETADARHTAFAYVIRGTDFARVREAELTGVPARYHSPANAAKRRLEAGEIVFEVSGGSKDQPVGRTLFVKATTLAEFGDVVIPASFCKRISIDRSVADPAYIYYLLNLMYANRTITQWQTQSTGISNFSFEKFLDQCEIDIPALPAQRRTAEVLSAYDELVENNVRRMRLLESMARGIYESWFAEFQFPGYTTNGTVESAMGPIPTGWTVRTVPQCIDVNPRVPMSREGEKPFVSMSGLSDDSMVITDIASRAGKSGAQFQNGDTLFARITPCLENGKTGFVQFLANADSAAFGSTEFIVLRSRTLTPEFVYLLARSERFRANAIKSMTGTSGRQRVQERSFDEFLIAEPPSEVLNRFSATVKPMFRLIQVLHQQNEVLRRAQDLLLPRLLPATSGRLGEAA
jgi:type I restriction enzyme, S subunit